MKRYFILKVLRYRVPAFVVFDRKTGTRHSMHYKQERAERIVDALNRGIEAAEPGATGHGHG